MSYNTNDSGATWKPTAGDSSGNSVMVGPAAHDAAASGNPLRVGGVYRSSDPAVANGDLVDLALTAAGLLRVQVDRFASHAATQVTADGNIKASLGTLYGLVIAGVGVAAGNTVVIKDGSSGAEVLRVVFSAANETIIVPLPAPISFSTAIYADITVSSGTAYVTGIYD